MALLEALDTFMSVQNRNMLLLAHNYADPPEDTSFVRNIKVFLVLNAYPHLLFSYVYPRPQSLQKQGIDFLLYV
jgi:hypothetical protein